MVDFLVGQRRDVEVALVGKIEGELQTGDEVTLGRSQEGIFRIGVGADLERNIMQRPHREGMGVEDFVPAERRADQAVDFGCARAICRRAAEQNARVRAGRGRVVMIRFEHRDGEEVGAVGPRIEVGERIDLFGGLAVDGAIRLDAKSAGIGALGHP